MASASKILAMNYSHQQASSSSSNNANYIFSNQPTEKDSYEASLAIQELGNYNHYEHYNAFYPSQEEPVVSHYNPAEAAHYAAIQAMGGSHQLVSMGMAHHDPIAANHPMNMG